ncbi:MAG TPA: type II toxin-antitoxin system VapC family toxin [Luteolibacter sp.]|nr:type II toxin-antitoxin system VapC family toxin [Luteolibacter sp.]
MKLLLDTHVLVWAESMDHRLGPATRGLLLDSANTLLVSPVTSLELARLVAMSRLTLGKPLGEWFSIARRHLGFDDAPFLHDEALESYDLPGSFHKDPADRILVATARLRGCTLMTADDSILGYPHVAALDARL